METNTRFSECVAFDNVEQVRGMPWFRKQYENNNMHTNILNVLCQKKNSAQMFCKIQYVKVSLPMNPRAGLHKTQLMNLHICHTQLALPQPFTWAILSAVIHNYNWALTVI